MIDEKRLYPVIGERLRRLREGYASSRGRLTQAELAVMVGLERTSITNIEKGTQKVPLHVLYKICSALGAHVAEVLPSLADVQQDVEAPSTQAFELGGRTYQASPMLSQKITALLNTFEAGNGTPHH